ncbi:MSMEG_0567/Sll0786 family nitrogen starvation N-acetyltransferase [Paenibacillus sp. R14(2021)]|uniref:MSMEG_0567/Sll0786 family nitrogen starvation N-acetyltransferase n=1 Tax=Paenibacillus sp. R14(2021) TaxID=2859228 RepID=UPI00215855A9|nr:MSMEG_0567/Sll0786 family nitrogen starvation N-acetyltransferase [Paenibacillus sp. R14(2021)]
MAASEAELNAAHALRNQVFVEEQGLFDVTDEDEHDPEAIHLNAWRGATILMGTVRCYPDKHEKGTWWGGRLAVMEAYRLRGIGVYLIEAAVEAMENRGVERFLAQVQEQNTELFKKLGWRSLGEQQLIRGHLHQLMEAELYVHDAQSSRRRRLTGQ